MMKLPDPFCLLHLVRWMRPWRISHNCLHTNKR